MNHVILEFLYNGVANNSWLAGLVIFLAVYLPYLIVLTLLVMAIFSQDKNFWQKAAAALAAAASAWFLVFLFKELFPTPRPFEFLSNIVPLFPENFGQAFPSSHATFFSSLASALFFLDCRKISFWFAGGAVLIAIARVAAGVHWPTDVLAGLIIGGVAAYFFIKLFKSFTKQNE